MPIIVVIFSLTIVVVPFTVGLPRKEFLFSVVVAALSVIGFLPFGKAKRLRKYWSKSSFIVRPNKKIPVFKVTRPYLNLLVNPRFFRLSEKIYFFLHFEKQI